MLPSGWTHPRCHCIRRCLYAVARSCLEASVLEVSKQRSSFKCGTFSHSVQARQLCCHAVMREEAENMHIQSTGEPNPEETRVQVSGKHRLVFALVLFILRYILLDKSLQRLSFPICKMDEIIEHLPHRAVLWIKTKLLRTDPGP